MKKIRVAHIINEYTLVLNVGKRDGIESGQRFLVYALSDDEILDPETNESLGRLEIVRGTGVVDYLQDSMCIISSDVPAASPIAYAGQVLTGDINYKPFSSPKIGDYAREIN